MLHAAHSLGIQRQQCDQPVGPKSGGGLRRGGTVFGDRAAISVLDLHTVHGVDTTNTGFRQFDCQPVAIRYSPRKVRMVVFPTACPALRKRAAARARQGMGSPGCRTFPVSSALVWRPHDTGYRKAFCGVRPPNQQPRRPRRGHRQALCVNATARFPRPCHASRDRRSDPDQAAVRRRIHTGPGRRPLQDAAP